jgi:ABC-type antimicrobial peptide transport system permease subunit
MALGADRRRILGMVVRQSSMQVALGLLTGLGLTAFIATAAAGAIQGVLFNVNPSDPILYAGIGAIVVLVALAATFVPARRATKVDPLVALRAD